MDRITDKLEETRQTKLKGTLILGKALCRWWGPLEQRY